MSSSKSSREKQEQWRSVVPRVRQIVDEIAPASYEDASERQRQDVPHAWIDLVAEMQRSVHEEAANCTYLDGKPAERRGYFWHFKLNKLYWMVTHLFDAIRRDIEIYDDGATLASMLLVTHAIIQVNLELQEGGSDEGRGDSDEQRFRVYQALRALNTRFDDMNLRRLRALQFSEYAAKANFIPTDSEVEAHLNHLREVMPQHFNEKNDREFFAVDQPVMAAVHAQSELTDIDERFGTLDPLVIMEEFAEAKANSRGGKTKTGDSEIGPARALARLAVMCGALGYDQRAGETFDQAADRARTNLNVVRSRIRRSLREFPGLTPPDDHDRVDRRDDDD